MGFPDLESKCPPQQWKSSSHRTLFTAKTQSEATQSAEIQLVNGSRLPKAKMGVAVYLHPPGTPGTPDARGPKGGKQVFVDPVLEMRSSSEGGIL